MPTTTRGYRYPSSTSSVNVPADIQALAEDLDADVTANLRTTVSSNDGAATDGTTTSTFPTFTNNLATIGIKGVAFTAAETGRAVVHFAVGQGRTSGAGQSMVVGIEVRDGAVVGSGTVVYAANSVPSETVVNVSDGASQNRSFAGFALISGLTSGNSYNACLVYSVTGGTFTINRRNILVQPGT